MLIECVVAVSGGYGKVIRGGILTSGMVGAAVGFQFGEEWTDLTRTAVFRCGDVIKDVLNIGNAAVIPPEVLTAPGEKLFVGVYGVSAQGDVVIPTVWIHLGKVHPGTDPSGDTTTEESLAVWAQLQSQIGTLADLTTQEKDTLVEAVNEVHALAAQASTEGVVAYDRAQILSGEQQAQARENIGAADAVSVEEKIQQVCDSIPAKLPNPQSLIVTGTTMGDIVYNGANVAVINIPKALPNPNALIVTGTPEGDIVYNGSEGKVINIPAAGESAKDVTEAYTASGLSNETDYLLTLTEPGEYLIQRTAENYRFRCQVENVNGALYHWIRTYGDDSIYGELLYIDGALVSDKEIDYTGALYDVDVIDGVRYPRLGTSPQTLTEAQRENARNNIGAIPPPASAAVGQTIVVKAVDEEGKPTEWECMDAAGSQWKLIRTITVPEDVSTDESDIEWYMSTKENYTNVPYGFGFSTTEDGSEFAVRELYILANVADLNGNYFGVSDQNGYHSGYGNLGYQEVTATLTKRTIHILTIGEHSVYTGYVANATSLAAGIFQSRSERKDEDINSLWIGLFGNNALVVGSTFEVWGR